MRRYWISPMAASLLTAGPGRTAAPELTSVASLDQLRRVAPIRWQGWELRFGLADSGPDGGAWQVV